MSWFTDIFVKVQKDEQWVIAEIAKGWHALETAEQKVVMDAEGVLTYIQTHQAAILATLKVVLTDLAVVGAFIPHSAPIVGVATLAIDASTAAIDALSKAVIDKSTAVSELTTLASASYVAFKGAQSAVNTVLAAKAASPTP
jgi:hypothetical protein